MTSESTSCPVAIVGTHTVQCAHSSSLSKIPPSMKLGALDQQVYPTIPVAVVFVYSTDDETSHEIIPADKLQTALSYLLDYCPHLTGRLHIDPTTGTRSIDRLGSGVHLHVAQCTSRLDALVTSSPRGRLTLPDLPDGGNALLPPFEPTLESVCSDRTPILSVQHTRFACGGVALGLRALHTVVDLDAFFLLAHDLAEVYRSDVGTLANPPSLNPYLADQLDEGMPPEKRETALKFKPQFLSVDAAGGEVVPEYAKKNSTTDEGASPPPPPVTGRVMRFYSAQLDRLKAAATDPVDPENGWVSTYDALSALLWMRVYDARVQLKKAQGDKEDARLASSEYLTSVNYCSHLALPQRYPFNAILMQFTTLSHGALTAADKEASLHEAARTVHAMTRSMSPDEARATARWVAAQRDKRSVKWEFNGGYGATMVSVWNKFGMYVGMEFDGGRPPVLVAPPFTVISCVDGLGYYLPTEKQNGEIDLYLALNEPVWAVLEEDEFWLRFRD
ncbi:transferase [Fomes fomentarius]|nr:transferase [Fomes fomentarius]